MARIAVYGKGGIGKSTISANLSAALALSGKKVLQIGCDPKHDSTRFLMHGRRQQTVLDYLRKTDPGDYRVSDILEVGFAGVGCVEAGGPKPGVGCAGRGIISTFELLDQFRLNERYEMTIYDVLGDVVCGGFAVPIRRDYADTILIVTSGEFMALYAANNILRGIQNYDGMASPRIAGLVFNRRNVEGEEERVRRFAKAVQLPVFTVVPRSDAFTESEKNNMTAMEQDACPEVTAVFRDMAERLCAGVPMYKACPLTDEELETTILGEARPAAAASGREAQRPAMQEEAEIPPETDLTSANRYRSKNLVPGAALQGCAFNGAIATIVQTRDAAVIAHSPKSCVYITYQGISSSGRRTLFERGTLIPGSLAPNLVCSEMGEPEIVFGGLDELGDCVRRELEKKPGAVFVISSCPAGIIGDDISRMAELSTPDIPVIPIRTDGNMAGDFLQGTFMAFMEAARGLIDRNAKPRPYSVNILGEKATVTNTDANFRRISSYLSAIGISVNARYLCQESVGNIRNFCAAPLTLPAFGDFTATTLTSFFENEFGLKVMHRGFPVGYDETADWLREVAAFFGRETEAEKLISEEEKIYRAELEPLIPVLKGKRLMVATYNFELDWILRPAIEAGMEIVKIGVFSYSQDVGFRTRLDVQLPVEEGYPYEQAARDVAELKPDILLTNYSSGEADIVPVADTIPMCPDTGFDAGIQMMKRWAGLLGLRNKGVWKKDEALFRQYYA